MADYTTTGGSAVLAAGDVTALGGSAATAAGDVPGALSACGCCGSGAAAGCANPCPLVPNCWQVTVAGLTNCEDTICHGCCEIANGTWTLRRLADTVDPTFFFPILTWQSIGGFSGHGPTDPFFVDNRPQCGFVVSLQFTCPFPGLGDPEVSAILSVGHEFDIANNCGMIASYGPITLTEDMCFGPITLPLASVDPASCPDGGSPPQWPCDNVPASLTFTNSPVCPSATCCAKTAPDGWPTDIGLSVAFDTGTGTQTLDMGMTWRPGLGKWTSTPYDPAVGCGETTGFRFSFFVGITLYTYYAYAEFSADCGLTLIMWTYPTDCASIVTYNVYVAGSCFTTPTLSCPNTLTLDHDPGCDVPAPFVSVLSAAITFTS